MSYDLKRIKSEYLIDQAWRDLRLPGEPKASCHSPFRDDDKHPSFSIFDNGRAWKDHATGQGGSVVDFVMAAHRCDAAEAIRWLYERHGIDRRDGELSERHKPQDKRRAFTITDLQACATKGDSSAWEAFGECRGYTLASVEDMVGSGYLRFARLPWSGKQVPCYVVTDRSWRAAEVRQWNGGLFGSCKAFPLSGVDKSCPLGLPQVLDGDHDQGVLITEGSTDFLAAIDLYTRYKKAGGAQWWQPLGVLGAGIKQINPTLLDALRCRRVRLVPDGDEAGRQMAEYWRGLLPHAEWLEPPEGQDLTDMARCGLNPNDLFS